MKEVNKQNQWNFELASQESTNVPIWITVGLQQRDGRDSQNLNIDTLFRLPVTRALFIIETEKILMLAFC